MRTSKADPPASASTHLPMFLDVPEVADLLRTTPKAIYARIERRQLPGVTRLGKRLLVRSDVLLQWLDQQGASSLQGDER